MDDDVSRVLIEDDISRFMEAEGIDFIEAVERLAAARRARSRVEGIVIPFPHRERV